MGELKEINKNLCKTCKYSTRIDGYKQVFTACYYARYMNHTRLYEKGKKQHDGKLCDKYEERVKEPPRWDETFAPFGKGVRK